MQDNHTENAGRVLDPVPTVPSDERRNMAHSSRPKRATVAGRGRELFFGSDNGPIMPTDAPPITLVAEPVSDLSHTDPLPATPTAVSIDGGTEVGAFVSGATPDNQEVRATDTLAISPSGKPADEPFVPLASGLAVPPSVITESQKDRLSSEDTARLSDVKSAAGPEAQATLELLWDALCEDALQHNTFRYSKDELELLTDVVYEVGREHDVKMLRQDVLRLGLNYIIHDYRDRGDESLLSALARRRKRQRRGK